MSVTINYDHFVDVIIPHISNSMFMCYMYTVQLQSLYSKHLVVFQPQNIT